MQLGKTKYSAYLYTDDGQWLRLDGLIQQRTREEHPNQLAQKVTLNLANRMSDGSALSDRVKLLSRVYLYAEEKEVFRGVVWDWNPTENSSDYLALVLYDNLIFAEKSEDDRFYPAGSGTKTLLEDIMKPLGIAVDYRWLEITHDRKRFHGRTHMDMALELLEEVRRQKGGRYVLRGDGERLVVDYPGTNREVYAFEGANTVADSVRLTMEGVVTRAVVHGRAGDDSRSPVEAVVEGKTEFGRLQKVIYRESNQTLAAATAEAQNLIDEQGQPLTTRTLKAPDLPAIRKGDKIRADTRLLHGYYIVLGVTHNATSGSMELELEEWKSPKQKQGAAGGAFQRGDAVILNGRVYGTSYGEAPGRVFDDYRTTITIVADTARMCPYHCGSIGWAEPSSLTKEGS